MAYVNVADWNPEQVTEWLKGLDSVILPYIHSFVNNEVDGQQLLSLRPDDLEHRGITKVGHQEIILEAIEYLRNFHYELDRENVQLLALRLSCQAHSLHRTLSVQEEEKASTSVSGLSGDKGKAQSVSTQTLADVAGVIACIKPLALWLDRPPFSNLPIYQELRTNLLSHALNIATSAQRDRFAERPVDDIRQHCEQLAKLADEVIQEYSDPLILQPASLDLASIRRRAGDELGFFLAPSLSGAPQIVEVKLQGAAHQSGKVEEGDEIVQVNYQTVVGWRLKAVSQLLVQEPSAQVFLTLKKRPRHSNVYGQIYIKPYRLPSRKRNPQFIRWHEPASPRPELLSIPHFVMPQATTSLEVNTVSRELLPSGNVSSGGNTSDEEEDDSAFIDGDPEVSGVPSSSPSSVRLRLPRPRSAVTRRATVTCASPTSKHPPEGVELLRAEIQREMQRRGLPTPKRQDEPTELRSKSGSAVSLACRRPCTVMGSCSSESGPRSPFSPLSPFGLRNKVHQTSSNPLTPPAYQAPRPFGAHSSTQIGPSNYQAGKANIPLPTPTHHSHKTSPPIKYVPTAVTVTPPESSSSHQQFLDFLPEPLPRPTSSLSSHVNLIVASILDDDGTGETLHERAVDCSPIPPPRPASSLRGAAIVPSRAPPTEPRSPASHGSTRNLVARTVSRTKQRLSPRTDRKKANNLLNKGRAVSYKQLGELECEGWLLQRARAAAGASWSRAWFALKETALYGFSSPEAKKADKLISLPGFTAAAAPEVKSRQFAFKVYHTGTAFYFAAGCAEELQRWLGCLGIATLGIRPDSATPYFSETDDEEQPARPPARAASSGNVSGDQENRSDERRFGSLRRLAGGWRTDEGATSLDRKYLQRLLRQEAVVPVPTAQFRSYRRVDRGNVSANSASTPDPAHSRTLPSRLGGSRQQRIMSVESVSTGSTGSLPIPQGLPRESVGSSPHLATLHEPSTPSSPVTTDKAPRRMLRLFSPVLGRKLVSSSKSNDPTQHLAPTMAPTLLGSPKLHRALFRGRRQPPQTSNTTAVQPRRIPPTLPEDSPPPIPAFHPETVVPDYPGLEYPPVFEPGTYTLNPEAREQWRSSRSTNTRHVHTNRTLLLPKPKDACWPTQNMNLSGAPHQRSTDISSPRRIMLTSQESSSQRPRRQQHMDTPVTSSDVGHNRRTNQQQSALNQEAVLIPPLDLLSATDV